MSTLTLTPKTSALHAGHDTKLTEGYQSRSIYQTSSYVFNDTEHAPTYLALRVWFIYTRLNKRQMRCWKKDWLP